MLGFFCQDLFAKLLCHAGSVSDLESIVAILCCCETEVEHRPSPPVDLASPPLPGCDRMKVVIFRACIGGCLSRL